MPIEPWWETNPATTPRQELGMLSPELSARHRPGAYTERQYAKVCADTFAELREWADRLGHATTIGTNGGNRHQGCLGGSSPGRASINGTEGSHWQGYFLSPGSLFNSGEGAWPKLPAKLRDISDAPFSPPSETLSMVSPELSVGASQTHANRAGVMCLTEMSDF